MMLHTTQLGHHGKITALMPRPWAEKILTSLDRKIHDALAEWSVITHYIIVVEVSIKYVCIDSSANGSLQMSKWPSTKKYSCFLTKMKTVFCPFRSFPWSWKALVRGLVVNIFDREHVVVWRFLFRTKIVWSEKTASMLHLENLETIFVWFCPFRSFPWS